MSTAERWGELSAASELAVEVQRLRAGGLEHEARDAADELIRLMQPLLRRSARRFDKARGSLSQEDLLQTARLAAFKAIASYDASRGQTFEQWSYWSVNRALKDDVRLRAYDVHVSEGDARGRNLRTRRIDFNARAASIGRSVAEVQRDLESDFDPGSTDAARIGPESDDPHAFGVEHRHAEALLLSEQQRARVGAALRTLSGVQRDLIRRVYGIGCDEQSHREIARVTGVPRARVAAMIADALALLRSVVDE